jgi:stage V sporulation protein S
MEQLKVSTKSNPNSVAGAMAGVVRQVGVVEVQVVGAGALNQAIKAVAIARGYVAAGGIDLVCVPSFADIEIDGERRTAIRLIIEDRERRRASEEVIMLPDDGFAELVAFEDPDPVPPVMDLRLN